LSLKPYVCAGGINTIGYGSTYYTNGKKVTLQDKPITKEQAEELIKHSLSTYEKAVDSFCRDDISQSQFDALVSFAYNLGTGALQKSTLIKKVNANPQDPTIKAEFFKWNKAGGRALAGLTKRRQAEADLYFS
jgi:lysozyme